MIKIMRYSKCIGFISLSFGAGVILSIFMPPFILAVIESAMLIFAGVMYLCGK